MLPFFENEASYKLVDNYQLPKWGFYKTSEILNGRLAMIALFLVMGIEITTKQSILKILNLCN
uniref:hypothetical protein n=1 Tax=Dictyotopsis propagulifera TaxID=670095 RepID=UPI002E7A29CF|nr:hypothetical protein V2485_pgp020 [Dictyotopsis propagulifera]WAM63237.1 hypothetical protein [Dictyotopsis propagulifera]